MKNSLTALWREETPPGLPFRLVLAALTSAAFFLTCFFSDHFTQFTETPDLQALAMSLLYAAVCLFGTLLLYRACAKNRLGAVLVSLLVLGAMVLRLLFLEKVTQDYDYFLSQWVQMYRDGGGFAVFGKSIGDYNAPYLYFLCAISYLPLSDFYLIKLFSILFDFLLVFWGVRLISHFKPGQGPALWGALGLLFFPTFWLNSAWWAQCDSLYVSLIAASLLAFLEDRPKRGLVYCAVALSIKLQTVFYLPLLAALLFQKRIRWRDLWTFPAAYAGMVLPALFLGKPLGEVLGVYVNQTTSYASRLTLNAPSIFQFAPEDAPIKPLMIAGIMAAFCLVAIVLLNCWDQRREMDDRSLLLACLVLAAGIPLLLPSMHDRYYYLAEFLVVVVSVVMPKRAYLLPLMAVASLSGYLAYLTLTYVISMRLGVVCLMAVVFFSYLLLKKELYRNAVAP